MSRYIRDEQIDKPDDFVEFIIQDFLNKNDYKRKEMKGELVWQEGTGMLTPPKFFKYSYANGRIHIEAWMKTAWLPGVYTGENNLSGFVGALPKQAYKESIEELVRLLYQPLPTDSIYQNQNIGQTGAASSVAGGGPVIVQGIDNSRYAKTGLILALLGLIGLIIPIFGILFGAMGIVYGNKGKGSSKSGMAKAAFVIGIIAVILSVANIILGVMLTAATMY